MIQHLASQPRYKRPGIQGKWNNKRVSLIIMIFVMLSLSSNVVGGEVPHKLNQNRLNLSGKFIHRDGAQTSFHCIMSDKKSGPYEFSAQHLKSHKVVPLI